LCCPDIDFGFLLSNSPGSLGFEMAPFKLPQDYVDILGGMDTEKFSEFKVLLKKQFREVRKHADRIIMIVELMQKGNQSPPLLRIDFHDGSYVSSI
jgi:phosphatidylinositol kinase/protein kinase (PI-3  family)